MSFCTACGTNVSPDSRFCTKCGKEMQPLVAGAPAKPSGGGSTVLKVLFGVAAALVLFGFLAVGVAFFVGKRVADSVKADIAEGKADVQLPMGRVETDADPEAIAREIGIRLYPGATAVPNGSNIVSMGEGYLATIFLESNDDRKDVIEFYKQEYPGQIVAEMDNEAIFTKTWDDKSVLTITIKEEDGKTRILISRMGKR